jgi:hypothetical protein
MDGIGSIPSTLTDGKKTEIMFVNRMNFVVQVYCRDLKGIMRYKMRLLPNWAEKSEAYVGQTWLVTDEKKNLYISSWRRMPNQTAQLEGQESLPKT